MIDTLYLVVGEAPDGSERALGYLTPTGRQTMVTEFRQDVLGFIPPARGLAIATRRPFRILEFTAPKDVTGAVLQEFFNRPLEPFDAAPAERSPA